jgi:hypothetical protein
LEKSRLAALALRCPSDFNTTFHAPSLVVFDFTARVKFSFTAQTNNSRAGAQPGEQAKLVGACASAFWHQAFIDPG